jgi:alcohol dehydrogenase class IV
MTDALVLRGNWNYPTAVRFGAGRIAELPDACRQQGIQRPLLVTDPGLSELLPVKNALGALQESDVPCGLFSDVRANPVEANVNAGLAAYRRGDHDGVIALGGGSALDAGKAIALMVGQRRPIWDFEDREDWYTRVDTAGMAPVIAVPTTAGTGSEVGRAAVITDEVEHVKRIIFHPRMMPAEVIADPALTLGLSPSLTAATGMDALSHNLEAYCSPVFHPMAQGIALEAIKLIHDWLPTACRDGQDLAARAHMMAASTMGATAFQKGLGAMHSLSHPCGALLGTHHGLTNAIVMPYVLIFNRPAIQDKMAGLARYLGLPNPSFDSVLDWILNLRETIGIPRTLADVGVKAEELNRLAPMAVSDPSSATNPVPLTKQASQQLYRNAIEGVLVER